MRFAEDHPIELIQGTRKPSIGKVLKELKTRSVWLAAKAERLIKENNLQTSDKNGSLRELVAVARAIELLEALKKGNNQ